MMNNNDKNKVKERVIEPESTSNKNISEIEIEPKVSGSNVSKDDMAHGSLSFNNFVLPYKKRNILNFVISGLLFIAFLIFTILLKFVDVDAIGPNNSSVGFSKLNKAIADAIGYNDIWYKITNILGYLAILLALGFAIYAFVQLCKRKSIKRVDTDLILLGAFYISVIAFYCFFELFVVNYRPVLVDGALEASYPSSHTMLTISICCSSIFVLRKRIKSNEIFVPVSIALAIVSLVTVVGRIASGVHWFTDIIGACLLSAFLVMLYFSFVYICEKKLKINNKENEK